MSQSIRDESMNHSNQQQTARRERRLVSGVASIVWCFLLTSPLAAENALPARPKDEEALREEQIKKLKQKIEDLVLDNDILREALKPYPLARGTSDE